MTLQAKLLRLIISIVTIATFFAAIHGYRNSQSHLNALFDKELVTIAHFMATSDGYSASPIDTDNSFLYQVFNSEGQLLSKAQSAPNWSVSDMDNGFSEQAFSGSLWRIYALSLNGKRVLVGQSMNERKSSADDILLVTITPIVWSIPVIGLLIFYVVRKSLAPLRQLSTQLSNKSSEDLRPITIEKPSEELIPVVNRLNQVFVKLSEAFELEKQVSANAAHELRTPVSVLAIAANNLRTSFSQQNITDKQLAELTQGVDRMANVIEQIINLFRFTPDNFSNDLSYVDVEKVLQEVITNNYDAIEAVHQNIALNSAALHTKADPFALYVLFENIIRNAIKYAGEHASINIHVYALNAKLMVDIDDNGKGLVAEEREQLTQRFYRGSNQTDIKGSGLGLAIAKRIANLHNADISFDESPQAGLRVRISLDLAIGSQYGP